jgi:hypothetical protein
LKQTKRILLLIAVWIPSIFMGIQEVRAQNFPQTDSNRIYKELKVRSNRSKFTKWLFRTIIVERREPQPARDVKAVNEVDPFAGKQGKIIRTIRIKVLDPFGQSVNDTARRPGNRYEGYGNKAHVSSKAFLIRNQLLFREGDSLNALDISESERLLRQAPYITDARIYINLISRSNPSFKDTVDVTVWVQDQWSIIPESGFDPAAPNLQITDKNFLGLGTSIRQELGYRFSDNSMVIRGQYGLSNLRKSFVRTNLIYQVTRDVSAVGIHLDRPFFSPLTRWACGFSSVRTSEYFYPYPDTLHVLHQFPLVYDVVDGWLGKSWQIESGKSELKRSTSLVAGLRAVHTEYHVRPGHETDVYHQNSNQTLFLASFGISKREFYKEKYLYRFGANEDVPIGFSFQATAGHQMNEWTGNLFYSGASASMGGFIQPLGYFAVQLEYGNFYNKINISRGLIRENVNYFSNLGRVGKWSVRQFASLSSVFGIDREPYEFVNLNGSQMYGFSSSTVKGTSKAILNLETVFYIPYNVLGFRLAPVLFIGLGKIGDDLQGLLNSRLYQAFSAGLLVRNENLVFNTFELSIGIYPYLPGGKDGIRLNPVSSYRLKVRDFALPRPEVLLYE